MSAPNPSMDDAWLEFPVETVRGLCVQAKENLEKAKDIYAPLCDAAVDIELVFIGHMPMPMHARDAILEQMNEFSLLEARVERLLCVVDMGPIMGRITLTQTAAIMLSKIAGDGYLAAIQKLKEAGERRLKFDAEMREKARTQSSPYEYLGPQIQHPPPPPPPEKPSATPGFFGKTLKSSMWTGRE